MPALIFLTDGPQQHMAAVQRQVETWFSARRQSYRVISPEAPGLRGLVSDAAAIVVISGAADHGAQQIGQVLRQLQAGSLAGAPFLWFHGSTAATELGLGQLWHALQHVGIEIVLQPVRFDTATDDIYAIAESRQLSNGLVALDESIASCRRLRRKRDSLDLSVRFALASQLA